MKALQLFTALATLLLASAVAQSPAQNDARMSWWREAKFGLFIHWGVYAVPARKGEWVMHNEKIPVATYRSFARDFNPVKYDPAAWAALAKEAGMRYVVITAKHHEGFALYPSDVTDWDIADASPYKKDLLGPLLESVHQTGLKMGSIIPRHRTGCIPAARKNSMKKARGGTRDTRGTSTPI
jgi:alpha-L-fucosidase